MRSLNIIHVFRAPLGGLFRHVVDLVNGQVARGHRVGLVLDNLTGDGRSAAILAMLAPCLALGIASVPIPRQLSPRDLGASRMSAGGCGRSTPSGAWARRQRRRRRASRFRRQADRARLYAARRQPAARSHEADGQAYLLMERALMSRGDLYLFESAYSANVFRSKVGTPRGLVRIVHNGISRGEFAAVVPAADASDIVFVGEFRPVKGIDTLIDAVAALHREGRLLTRDSGR